MDMVPLAVYEVVIPKPTEDSLSYSEPLPQNSLPYLERTDKYHSVGSAFAIGPNEYVSAAHVLNPGRGSSFGNPCLRDKNGKVFEIDKIVKYSELKDFIVFTLKNRRTDKYFQTQTEPHINRKVFAVGNALGEGVVIRDGLYTSSTPEDENGQWNWIRFSAAASPGNSGGPLLDESGRVIGVVLMKSANENLNDALPIGEILAAPTNTSIAYKKLSYGMANMRVQKNSVHKKIGQLPKTYRELDAELNELRGQWYYGIMKNFFAEQKENIFPNGKGSRALLHTVSPAIFPKLITQKEDGNWEAVQPAEIKQAELPGNGHLLHGTQGGLLFLSIQKPDDVSLATFYDDSKVFMDLLLKGVSLTREFASRKIRITSLGKGREHSLFVDRYGRKWIVNVWNQEYNDVKLVTFSLPVPGGLVTMLSLGQSGDVDYRQVPDLKVLANFIDVSYFGTLKKWREFLQMEGLLPSVLLPIEIAFDYQREFRYKSKKFSVTVPSAVVEISEKNGLGLLVNFYQEKSRTVWDVNSIVMGEETTSATSLGVVRNMRPPAGLNERFLDKWEIIAKRR